MNKDKPKDKDKDECPISLSKLKDMWDTAKSMYAKDHKRMKLLDATDRGELWKALGAKFPPYQILPDTNYVSDVKNNILASLYTVAKGATIEPTDEEDNQMVQDLNIALEHIWDITDIGYYQFRAGERASLLNLGITQIGWDEEIVGGHNSYKYKGNITAKNIDPIKFMRDPYATSLETSEYCMTYDVYHKSILMQDKRYKEEMKKFLDKQAVSALVDIPKNAIEKTPSEDKGYYTLIIFWVRHHGDIYQVDTIGAEHILCWKKVKPNHFPFAELYCEEPAGALIGSSPCAKIFANNVAYNLMDSITLTAELKNQRPPKFISSQSGLNVSAFSKHGDEADKTFIVNGDATKAVHYHQFPPISPAMPTIKQSLQYGIEQVSGVDGRYTGRDTGSIITTGGTEEMLNRVTIVDTPKIALYENYAKQLTKLVLANLVEFAPKRKYLVKKPNETKWSTVEIDYSELRGTSDAIFNYAIDISSELPKNKQRVEQMANQMMEKQMQYQEQGRNVQLITEEEWLMFQDIPRKEYMLERMGLQRRKNTIEEVSQTLFGYADLISKGATPDDALLATAEGLDMARRGELPPMSPMSGVQPADQMPMM